ncbi:unnamed protein product [Paramecium octaurelia]|nr:unnamed protein product [Paramecium octaurelia]
MIKNPSKRQGGKNGIDEILQHRWFKNIDIAQFVNKAIKQPFIPDLQKLNLKSVNQNDKQFLGLMQREQKQNASFKTMFSSDFYFSNNLETDKSIQFSKSIIENLVKKTLVNKQCLTNLQLQTSSQINIYQQQIQS